MQAEGTNQCAGNSPKVGVSFSPLLVNKSLIFTLEHLSGILQGSLRECSGDGGSNTIKLLLLGSLVLVLAVLDALAGLPFVVGEVVAITAALNGGGRVGPERDAIDLAIVEPVPEGESSFVGGWEGR